MELVEAATRRDELYSLLAAEATTLSSFVYQDPERIGHEAQAGGRSEAPAGEAGDATATAFALYMMFGMVRDRSTPSQELASLLESLPIGPLQAHLEAQIDAAYDLSPKHNSSARQVSENNFLTATVKKGELTSSAQLPNSYNTPIHLAGMLVADRFSPSEQLRKTRSPLALKSLVLGLRSARQLIEVADRGISSFDSYERNNVDLHHSIPNVPYLWYWNYVATLECLRFIDRTKSAPARVRARTEIEQALTQFRDYATTFVAYLTAAHYSGVDGQFDASDFLFAIGAAALRSQEEHHGGSEKVITHALSVFFDKNIAVEGSIVPRSPAFVDLEGHPITISTAEHAALLLEAVGPYCGPHLDRLNEVSAYLVGRRLGGRGWGSDGGRVKPTRNVFVVASSVAFMARYASELDTHAERIALRELGVPIESAADHLDRRLARKMEETFESQIVWPIRNGRRDLATMSLVLKGPPGTAKTTSARRIAALLGWPILTIAQGEFLRQGYENIEAEAERIFHLLRYAKDKVVLFDEFEEMISDRSAQAGEKMSRFLTTSMLPRLHRIRDDAAVVFVIATNHLEAVDPAAVRLGRVDLVMEVGYPDKATRRSMFDSLIRSMELSGATARLLQEIGFPAELPSAPNEGDEGIANAIDNLKDIDLNRFGYGEIKQVVKVLRLRELQNKSVTYPAIATAILEVANHSHTEAKL